MPETIPEPKPAKIEDVARAAGVSIMSVSRALRGVEGVSEPTRARILTLAKEMGYVPSRLAGSLALATSNLVAISVPTLFDGVFAEIVAGMRETLAHAGLETILETSDYDPAREAAWVERMITWSPAALVLSGVDRGAGVRARLAGAGVPVLEIWDVTETPADAPIDMCIGVDHRDIGQAMGRHLLGEGYRAPAWIGITAGRDPRAEKRRAGLAAAFGAEGVALADVRVDAPPSFEAGRDGALAALSRKPRPDVLCFLNDHLAFGGLMACESAGVGVPAEIGITGFNGLAINAVLPRRLTTSATPRKLMGKTAARLLVAAMRGVRTERRIVMPAPIEPGATTRAQLTRA
ncbi:MAG: LacI family DNA-binding transcriptional regulator [Pseudomonadota bacterium]